MADSYKKTFKDFGVNLKVVKVRNLGVSYSRNLGAKIATSPLLFFTDGDCLLKENTVSKLLDFFIGYKKSLKAIGAIQCKVLLLREDFRDRVSSAGAEISKLGYGWGRYAVFPSSDPHVNKPAKVLGLDGTGILIEKERFLSVGGFDEYFFYYFEPSDLALKLNFSGYDVFYCPFAEMYDFKGGSRLFSNPPERMKRFIKHHLAFVIKFYPARYLAITLPIATMIDIAIAVVVGVKYKNFRSFAAFVEIIRDLPILVKKRKQVQSLQKVNFKDVWDKMKSMRSDVTSLIVTAKFYGWLK